jgi:hypothetical protein
MEVFYDAVEDHEIEVVEYQEEIKKDEGGAENTTHPYKASMGCFGNKMRSSYILKMSDIPLMKQYILKHKNNPYKMSKLSKSILSNTGYTFYAKGDITEEFIQEILMYCCQFKECSAISFALSARCGLKGTMGNFMQQFVTSYIQYFTNTQYSDLPACMDMNGLSLGLFLGNHLEAFKHVHSKIMTEVSKGQVHEALWKDPSKEGMTTIAHMIIIYSSKVHFLRIYLICLLESIPWAGSFIVNRCISDRDVVVGKVILSIMDGMPEYIDNLDNDAKRKLLKLASSEGMIDIVRKLVK